jgi:polysaccharide biosynthesis transport protein
MSGSLTPINPAEGAPSSAPSVPLPLPAAAAPGSAEPRRTDLVRVLAALKRFRWLILALTVVGLGGGILATRFLRPKYTVSATIWIETPTANQPGTPIQGEELLGARAWVELLRSYKVLDPVVQERKLYLPAARGPHRDLFAAFQLADRFLPGDYELTIDGQGRTYELRHRTRLVTESGTVGDSVGRTVGFLWRPRLAEALSGQTITFEVLTPREASAKLNDELGTSLREENFLSIELAEDDPEAAAATMNLLISRFVDEAAAQKREKLTLLAQVLDTQVVNQAEKLKAAEQALESFRVGTVTLPREETPVAAGLQFTQPTVYSTYFQMNTDLEAIRRDRRAIEDVLRRTQAGELSVDAFNTISAVKAAPDLQRVLSELSTAEADVRALLTQYTEQYKGVQDLRERINTIRSRTIPLYANALVVELRNKEAELENRIASAGRELRQIPSRAQTEARLRREVEQAELLFKSLENSRQQARLAEASAIPDVRILDSAVAPTRPSRNSAPVVILIGLAGGLALGLGLALLIDRVDRRFRYPEQVSQGLGLPILGTIPKIRTGNNGASDPEHAAQVIESFRSVRLNLSHSFEPGASIALVISSPAPGDGKSFVAANLALSFAEAGYRTVLVDGDIRRGDLHRTFGAERQPGLIDCLLGAAHITGALRSTTHARLVLMPSGARRREGPELLGQPAMKELVRALRQSYEVIIVDSPPLGAGIDPFVLSTTTGNLALVLRAGETDRQLAEAKLQVLDRLPVRLLGAILNDVRVGQGAYRYYSYSYGYVAEGDEEPRLPARTETEPA